MGGLAAQAAFVLIEALIARRLGQSSYGTFSTVYAISMLAVCMIDLGMGWKLIQDGARRPKVVPTLLGTTLLIRCLVFLASYPVALGVLHGLRYDPVTIGFFTVFYGYALIMILQDLLAAVHAAEQHMEVNAVFQGGTPLMIGLLGWFLIRPEVGVNSVAWAYLTGGLLVALIWMGQTFRRVRPRVELGRIWPIVKGSYLYGPALLRCSKIL